MRLRRRHLGAPPAHPRARRLAEQERACVDCGSPVREITDPEAEWAWTFVEALSGRAQYCQVCFDQMGRRGEAA